MKKSEQDLIKEIERLRAGLLRIVDLKNCTQCRGGVLALIEGDDWIPMPYEMIEGLKIASIMAEKILNENSILI